MKHKCHKYALKVLHDANFKSFAHTFITDILYDAAVGMAFSGVVTGDFSKASLYALGYAVFRTLLRTLREWSYTKFPKNEPDKSGV